MYSSQLLIIMALWYEAIKQVAASLMQALWLAVRHQIVLAAEKLDEATKQPQKCSGDLLCQSQGVRHKNDCIGRTLPFTLYAKELTKALQ